MYLIEEGLAPDHFLLFQSTRQLCVNHCATKLNEFGRAGVIWPTEECRFFYKQSVGNFATLSYKRKHYKR